jgi:hypothetical protein
MRIAFNGMLKRTKKIEKNKKQKKIKNKNIK